MLRMPPRKPSAGTIAWRSGAHPKANDTVFSIEEKSLNVKCRDGIFLTPTQLFYPLKPLQMRRFDIFMQRSYLLN